MAGEEKKTSRVIFVGMYLLILAIISSGIYLFVRAKKEGTHSKENQNVTISPTQTQEDATRSWVTYTNPEYKFSIRHPRFLYPTEIVNKGGYLVFIRFEENSFSQGKGLAVGVSEALQEEEVKRVKKEIASFFEGTLTKEEEIGIGDIKGIRLEYEPEEKEVAEDRSIVIFTKGNHTFSISSVPEQIEQIVLSFKTFEKFIGCQDLNLISEELSFLKAYCNGEFCFPEETRETCERIDIVEIDGQSLAKASGEDEIGDCIWDEKETFGNRCRPRY